MADFLIEYGVARRPAGRLWALLYLPRLWIARASARKELLTLDASQMRDCGLDPMSVRREAIKPFWRD
jgi:uncharacterized protein YjiS (DUF1127 family)